MSSPLLDALAPMLRGVADGCTAGAMGLMSVGRAARFLSQRAAFVERADDVFISSYPRSGTTWLQLITHLVLRGGGLDFRHINEVVPWYERSLALGRHSALDFNAMPGPRAFKSHLPYAWLPSRGRLIYVRRNVHDVALSYYGLYRTHLGYRGTLTEFIQRFVRGELQYRSWYDHVAHWQRHEHEPRVLWLRYEEMRRDPRAAVHKVARFLGVTLSPERLEEISALCSLENMKRAEERFDHATEERYHLGMQSGKFLGEGARARGLSVEQRSLLSKPKNCAAQHPHWADLPAFLH